MRGRLDRPVLTSSTPATCYRPRRRSRVSRRLASLALATNRRPDTAREHSRCIHSSRANAPSQCRTHHHRVTVASSDTLRRSTDGGQHRTPTPPHPGSRDVTFRMSHYSTSSFVHVVEGVLRTTDFGLSTAVAPRSKSSLRIELAECTPQPDTRPSTSRTFRSGTFSKGGCPRPSLGKRPSSRVCTGSGIGTGFAIGFGVTVIRG